MAAFLPWAGLAMDAIGIGVGAHSADKANQTNIELQRRAQEWEAMMSNTAVQRRADDIQKAGGNRALAFTGGQSASSPTISPATVEPTMHASDFNFTAKALQTQQAAGAAAQVALTKATTAKTIAETQNLLGVEAQLKHEQTHKTYQEGVKTQAETRNLATANDALLAEIRAHNAATGKAISEKALVDFELALKRATREEAIKLIRANADAAKYGVSKANWESLLYKWLSRLGTTGLPGGAAPGKPLKGPDHKTGEKGRFR